MCPTLVSPWDLKIFIQDQPKHNLSCIFHAGGTWNSGKYNGTPIQNSEYLKQQQTPAHRLKEKIVKKDNNYTKKRFQPHMGMKKKETCLAVSFCQEVHLVPELL